MSKLVFLLSFFLKWFPGKFWGALGCEKPPEKKYLPGEFTFAQGFKAGYEHRFIVKEIFFKIVLKSGVQNSNIKVFSRLITSGLLESLWLMCVCVCVFSLWYLNLRIPLPDFSGKMGFLVFLTGVRVKVLSLGARESLGTHEPSTWKILQYRKYLLASQRIRDFPKDKLYLAMERTVRYNV